VPNPSSSAKLDQHYLTAAALVKLRDLDVVPDGAYCYSTPVNMPTVMSTDFLFGIGNAPDNEGQTTAPAGFSEDNVGGSQVPPPPPVDAATTTHGDFPYSPISLK
jgi:hypothetical protein